MNNYSTKNSNKDTPSSLFGSSEKKKKFMATINEDIFESQHNSSIKMTRNNEDLKDVEENNSWNKKSFSDFASMSNILAEHKEFSWSKTYRSPTKTSYYKKDSKKESKPNKISKIDYTKLTKSLQSSWTTHKIWSKRKFLLNNHLDKEQEINKEAKRKSSKSKSKRI